MKKMGLECPTSGFMGNWGKADKWERCTKLDFKGMFNYFIIKQQLNWCLSTSVTPSTTQRPIRGKSLVKTSDTNSIVPLEFKNS